MLTVETKITILCFMGLIHAAHLRIVKQRLIRLSYYANTLNHRNFWRFRIR